MADSHQLKPGEKVQLEKISTGVSDGDLDRDSAEEQFEALRDELIGLQYVLYAEGRRKLLVVLQAMDSGGKDGTIRHVFKGVNPQGVCVRSFKAPSTEELAHDFLWRIHKSVPPAGAIGVFNRSHYEDVLIVRVESLVPEKVWRQRYRQINDFELHLTETGTTILKFYLHISRDEQKKRFLERLEDPTKQWKFSEEDVAKRSQWDDYMAAYEEALERCTTKHAPWYVIPADKKWYRNLAIMRVIVQTMRDMKLELPSAAKNLKKLQIE